MFLARGWRANVDMQILIYDSPPDKVIPADISEVIDYIVSYICKGTETQVKEKADIKDLILNSTEVHEGKKIFKG